MLLLSSYRTQTILYFHSGNHLHWLHSSEGWGDLVAGLKCEASASAHSSTVEIISKQTACDMDSQAMCQSFENMDLGGVGHRNWCFSGLY